MRCKRLHGISWLATASFFVLIFGSTAVLAQIIVDDAPLDDKDVLARKPLVAYRKIPQDAIASTDKSGTGWTLSTTAVLETARADPALKGTLNRDLDSHAKLKM